MQWREAQGLEWDGPLNPAGWSGVTRLRQRHNEGKQAGSLYHRAALPPLLPFGLDPDEHFEAACTMGQYPLPTERPPVMDSDLQFAAYMHAQEKDSLGAWRSRALGMLRELKRRWAPVSDRLRALQTDAIAQVTAKRDLGLTALLVVMTHGEILAIPTVWSQGYRQLAQRLATTSSPHNKAASSTLPTWWRTLMNTTEPSLQSCDQAFMTTFYCHRVWWMQTRALVRNP